MANILRYKGYYTKIEYSSDDSILYGKIEGINDLVNFESESALEIEKEFHSAVDDYLEFCKNVGKDPNKSYKGTFNVRISPDTHRRIALKALKEGTTLNQEVTKAIDQYLDKNCNIIDLTAYNGLRSMAISVGNEIALNGVDAAGRELYPN